MSAAHARLCGFGWRPLGRREEVISGLDLSFSPGEIVLLAGGSGAGKSTVLRALAGLLGEAVPGERTGTVEVDTPSGMLLQNPADSLVAATIGREVAFGPENLALPRAEIWSRVRDGLAQVGLSYDVDRPTSALSGGELQRLALAGVLAVRPGLLLLDEPTSMLDEETSDSVRRVVVAAARAVGATTVVVEHRIGPWLPHCDRVVVLDHGRVIADTTPAEFATEQQDRMLAAGVWMPDTPAPDPVVVDADWVRPTEPGPSLHAESVQVDLTVRSLQGSTAQRALNGATTTLRPGRLTALVGPSGAGKSTLLAAFAGLLRPTGGAITGPEPPFARRRSKELATAAGFVPQNPEHGFLRTTVRDEVACTATALGRSVDVAGLLALMRLDHLAGANPFQLSGGEQRRLAVLAALAHRPGVVLLDEPTVGQDRHTWAAVTGWALAARDAGATVGVATHDTSLVDRSDIVIQLKDGEAVG
ncbi:ABC transporter ATP-binding protein [Flexivirga endophytica]|uniref:ABC transporter ATP-binding protein n=1 Tax=Flexivirga endophytica TaxID=1849103 RepID=A0A916WPT1_9MICO|nr:ATP-binding cassette domain-containing protein [Flexivirga endophytica]GGB21131.1 ABC transporter ATP-binding protein [Flexivirga endophytica]GHB58852.1 ABC transporter ATP-binding protein [Flexivirga endophytica]